MTRSCIRPRASPGRPPVQLIVALGLAGLTALVASASLQAAGPENLPSNVKLEQWETQPQGNWITGALNENNSDYAEGETVPFRLVVPQQVDPGTYEFSVCRNYDDGERRGYLYHSPFDEDRPADAGGAIASTQDGFAAVNATLDAVTDLGARGACKAGDRETTVVITKGDGIAYVLWGGHLASPADSGVGAGNGAAFWPGASLHMKILAPSKDVAIQTCTGLATPSVTYTSTAAMTTTASVTATAFMATSTAVSSATSTPPPEATGTAAPADTATSTAVPTATPGPNATATVSARNTPTPTPANTSTPTPGDTTTPAPSATTTPRIPAPATTIAAARTATPSPAAAGATSVPTRTSQQRAAAEPRQLPGTGTCAGGGNDSLSRLAAFLGGLAVAAVAAAAATGGLWMFRRRVARGAMTA